MANRKYTDAQRAEAVQLVMTDGNSAASVARDFSISTSTLQRWVSDAVSERRMPQQRVAPAPTGDHDNPADHADTTSRIGDMSRRLDVLEKLVASLTHPAEHN